MSEVDERPRATLDHAHRPQVTCCWSQSNGRQLCAQGYNAGLGLIDAEVVALWDVDCWLPRSAIAAGAALARSRYDFVCVGETLEHVHRDAVAVVSEAARTGRLDEARLAELVLRRRPAPNGTVRFARTAVLRHLRGFNDRFLAWGLEDDELVERFARLGYRVGRLGGRMWHLDHPGLAGDFRPAFASGLRYLDRLRDLDAEALRSYFGVTREPGGLWSERLEPLDDAETEDFFRRLDETAVDPWEVVDPEPSDDGRS